MTDVKVEQSDRVAAFDLLGGGAPDGLLNGRCDSLSLVRTLARHRQAAENAQQERDAGIAEAEANDIRKSHLARDAWQQGRMIMADVIATAIRSQGHE